MKYYYWSLVNKRYTMVFTALIITIISSSYCASQSSCEVNARMYKKDYFSIKVPNDWKTSESFDSETFLQLSSISPDARMKIYVYTIKMKNEANIDKLSSLDTNLFKNLGNLVDTKTIREYLFFKKEIEKTYKANNHITKILFKVRGNVGYILLWQNDDINNKTCAQIASTLKTHLKFTWIIQRSINNGSSEIISFVKDQIIWIVIIGLSMIIITLIEYVRKIKK